MNQTINTDSFQLLENVTLPSVYRALFLRHGNLEEMNIQQLAKVAIMRSFEPAVSDLLDTLPKLQDIDGEDGYNEESVDADLSLVVGQLQALGQTPEYIAEFAAKLSEVLFVRDGLRIDSASQETDDFFKMLGREVIELRRISSQDRAPMGDKMHIELERLSLVVDSYLKEQALNFEDRLLLEEQYQHLGQVMGRESKLLLESRSSRKAA